MMKRITKTLQLINQNRQSRVVVTRFQGFGLSPQKLWASNLWSLTAQENEAYPTQFKILLRVPALAPAAFQKVNLRTTLDIPSSL
jgi:hypothetical protein